MIARSILITGGSGTFGRAFVRRCLQDGLAGRVCIYSRGEHQQAAMREELICEFPDEAGDEARCRWFIGCVRDLPRLRRAMSGVDIVVHAAALKRIEVGARDPLEMKKTNIDGAANVIDAAQDAGVRKVVFLSSDKAFEAVSPYGKSKSYAEDLFLAANNTVPAGGPRFAVCRYGNIWASNGSVVPRWLEMIARGAKAVPVTDPDCTRFFMRIEEAVGLVLRAIETMPKEPLIPELPAYRLGDLAEAMEVLMEVRGLPHWEKKHEGMAPGNTSDKARRMSVAELRERLAEIGFRPKVAEAA